MGDFFDDAFVSELTAFLSSSSVYASTTFWDPCAQDPDETGEFAPEDVSLLPPPESAPDDISLSPPPESVVSDLNTTTGIAAQDVELNEVTEPLEATSSDSKQKGAQDPKKPKRRRRNEIADTPEARAKREVSLKKNRMAAIRCRVKKRDWMKKLEIRHRSLSERNKLLRRNLASLNDAVFGLKGMALEHADCSFQPIDDYVRLEAEKVGTKARRSAGAAEACA